MKKYIKLFEEFVNEENEPKEKVYAKINMKMIHGLPAYTKLVRKLAKGGEVYVVSIDDDEAEIAESPQGAFLGTATVPLDSLKF